MVVAICCCVLAGCFEWSEDQNGNLKSVGLPGVPVWQAKKPSPPQGLTDTALTPDQASKVSGPVLVVPPDQPNEPTRYHYYETGQNNCQQDLAKLLAEKGGSRRTGTVLHGDSGRAYVERNRVRLLNVCRLERRARE